MAFLVDYFVKDVFRNELCWVFNWGEVVNVFKCVIYIGWISLV